MSTSSQTQPPTGVNRIQAERFARRAQHLEDPRQALVEAQLATAHATLALLDGLNAHRSMVLSDAAAFLESVGEAGPGYLLRTCDVPRSEEKDTREGESTPKLTVYRASHGAIGVGLHTTAAGARKHCEALVRQEEPADSIRHMSWSADDIGDHAEYELHITPAGTGGLIRGTGYVVTRVEVASEGDEEANE